MTIVEEYINQKDPSHQPDLNLFYSIIKEVAPMAQESLSWGMPTFKLNGNLVHFADNKNHLGFYPGPTVIVEFKAELNEYKHSKGTIQFPYHKELPVALIKKIVLKRIEENTRDTQG